jgi:hypothetical protein
MSILIFRKNSLTTIRMVVICLMFLGKPGVCVENKTISTSNNSGFQPAPLEYFDVLPSAGGYNPRFVRDSEPWQILNPNYQRGLVNSEANVIRYPPGGIPSTYWDYDNDRMFRHKTTNDPSGWVDATRLHNDTERGRILADFGAGGIQTSSVKDLKYAAKGGIEGNPVDVVFLMNMITPAYDFYKTKYPEWEKPVPGDLSSESTWRLMLDDRYERFRRMLIRASTGEDPIPVKYIELGNEYYFLQDYINDEYDFPGATIADKAANYAIASNYLAGLIRNDFPDVKIAATASSATRNPQWNSGLAPLIDRSLIEYVTMHIYKAYVEPEHLIPYLFQWNLTNWINDVNAIYENSGANQYFLNDDTWRVWYTETNANWDASVEVNTPPDRSSWARNLVDAFLIVHLYDVGNATLVQQFQFDNQVKDPSGNLYNRAKALIPYMRASKDAVTASKISFNETSMPKLIGHSSIPRALVQGYAFKTEKSEIKCMLINLSDEPIHIDLSALYDTKDGAVNLSSWAHPDIAAINPDINPVCARVPSNAITLPAYSSNYIDDKPEEEGEDTSVLIHIPADYSTVKAAIDAINADQKIAIGEEVTIQIAEGVFTSETITRIDKAIRLTIQGAGADKTTLQGLDNRPVPGIANDNRFMLIDQSSYSGLEINLRGIRFKNWGFGSSINGGFVSVVGANIVTVNYQDCEFEGMAARVGAVFQSNNFHHSFSMDNCFVHHCLSFDDNHFKGIMNFVGTGNISITNSTFMSNEQQVLNRGNISTGTDRGLREGIVITMSQGTRNPSLIRLKNNVFVNNMVVDGGNPAYEKPVMSMLRNSSTNMNPYLFEFTNNVFIGNSRGESYRDVDVLFNDAGTGIINLVNSESNIMNSMVKFVAGGYVPVVKEGFMIDETFTYSDPRIDFEMDGDLPKIFYDDKGIGFLMYHGDGTDPFTSINDTHYNSLDIFVYQGQITIKGLTAGEMIEVYSMTGSLVARSIAYSDPYSITLPRGIFVIRVGNRAKKVVVSSSS